MPTAAVILFIIDLFQDMKDHMVSPMAQVTEKKNRQVSKKKKRFLIS